MKSKYDAKYEYMEQMLQERVKTFEENKEQLQVMEQLKLANQQSSGNSNDKTTQDLQSLLQFQEDQGDKDKIRASLDSIQSRDSDGLNSDKDD